MNAGPSLAARLAAVRAALALAVGQRLDPVTAPAPTDDGLDGVVRAAGLTPFERDVLVLAAGCELDPGIAALCAAAHGDPGRRFPTLGLALRVLDQPHWDAVLPDGPLRGLALVDLDPGGLLDVRLRVEESVMLAVVGLDPVDQRLAEFADPRAAASVRAVTGSPAADTDSTWDSEPDAGPGVTAGELLPDAHRELLEEAAVRWSGGALALRGAQHADRVAFVRALAARLGARRWWHLRDLPVDSLERQGLARRLVREERLTGAPVVLEIDDLGDTGLRFAARLADTGARVVWSSASPRPHLPAPRCAVDLPPRTLAENVELWRAALGPRAAGLGRQVERLAGQFRLPVDDLQEAAGLVGDAVGDAVGGEAAGSPRPCGQPGGRTTRGSVGAELWTECRRRARTGLVGLAERVEPAATWDALVLPDRERAQVADVLRHARHRATVHERWGVGRTGGVSALFAGPSGTGKSFAAEVVARELGVDLYRVDLGGVLSKYIGETERHLSRLFDAAEAGGALLLIDEADALFGKRSEVRDSHDRYANIEVSHLLQLMDAYRGVAVLTTNLRGNLDDAFLRRLGFVISFPFPSARERRLLWEQAFGPAVPVGDLDPVRMAQLTLNGGSIRNVAVHACFLAAERGGPVQMADVLAGARVEYAKLDQPLTPGELAGWAA
ncbi:AAA family ATPase [Kineococcus aurantiacus]|uniref:AAA+ ATPase domain-containing protein n=1 Tax=Kineococcus aurantiacus TaxID=37633 RepID=A0A7Y9DQ10_9ACTN|nr:ATP-binding protein [Kineococcus aurantiacus]NYD24664.1 hypothetical protein [Kineococcus aurantiacus]